MLQGSVIVRHMVAGTVLLMAVLHAHGGVVPQLLARGAFAVAHSHNDYEQQKPLEQALAAGFPSVEADVWLRGDEIVVSHHGFLEFSDRGRLEDLYLRPLQRRVDQLGSVYGDSQVFYLWIDLKDSSRELTDALHRLLARYPMFTVFTDTEIRRGAVVAILTGDEEAKRRYTEEHQVRLACRDSNVLGDADPNSDGRWMWYALPWDDVVDASTVTERGSRAAQAQLRRVVERAHALGRRLRLYAVPERPDAWGPAIAAGVDLIGTDRIEAFGGYLRSRSELLEARAQRTPGWR